MECSTTFRDRSRRRKTILIQRWVDCWASGNAPFSKELGLDAKVAAMLIPLLAPFALSALVRRRDHGKGTEQSGEGIGGPTVMLDRDGDCGILDDVAGMVFNIYQRTAAVSGGGGILKKCCPSWMAAGGSNPLLQ